MSMTFAHWATWLLVVITATSLTPRNLSARSLTLAQARQLALEFNRDYLQAMEEKVKANADVTKARANAFPDVNFTGYYNRSFIIPSFFLTADDETIEFKTGFKNNYGATVSLTQSLWSGGKVFTAMKIAKNYRSYAEAAAAGVEAQVLYQAEVLFYDLILRRARLAVLDKSFEAAKHNLEVIDKFFSQGLASEFEVLRARVEKSNLQPQILKAQSDLRLSEKTLKSFLGLNLGEAVQVIEEPLHASLDGLPSLDTLIAQALGKRPEMSQAEQEQLIRRRAIKLARAEYYPSLSAEAAFDWQSQSDRFTMSENTSRSWTAGLRLHLPIFQGGATGGSVTQAVSSHRQAELRVEQLQDNIIMEVEGAHDRLLLAMAALDIQKNTIAMAEEGMRIANLRYETGVGTLLEVLSARAALTQARETLAVATFSFREARAALRLATTNDLEEIL